MTFTSSFKLLASHQLYAPETNPLPPTESQTPVTTRSSEAQASIFDMTLRADSDV